MQSNSSEAKLGRDEDLLATPRRSQLSSARSRGLKETAQRSHSPKPNQIASIPSDYRSIDSSQREKARMQQNRSTSANGGGQAQMMTPSTNVLAEQTDPEKRALQFENYLSTLSHKNSKRQGTAQATKSREIHRQFVKRYFEDSIHQSPLRGEEAKPSTRAEEGDDKLVCLIKTNEPHLRRAVEKRSYWCENRSKFVGSANIYDVKFEFQDQPQDYSAQNQKPFQVFNHFPNNTELTTKSGLTKNLYMNTFPGLHVDEWFPRSYDLSQHGQIDELIDDYQRTAVQIIIKKHYQLVKSICKAEMFAAYDRLQSIYDLRDSGKGAYNFRESKSNLYWELIQQFPCPEDVLVNTKHLDRAFKFCKQLLKNQYSPSGMNDWVKDEFRPNDFTSELNSGTVHGVTNFGCQSIAKMFGEKVWGQLLSYSKLDLPVKDFKSLPEEIKLSKQEAKELHQILSPTKAKEQNYGYGYFSHGWERPTMLLIIKLIKYHKRLKQLVPQYATDGTRNVWIVKPCYNARGFGIYCIDNCLQEFASFVRNCQSQSKIVQKYIERPLLLHHLNQIRKFDIRQWVLVTSFDPLKVFVFDEFYLRICGSKYDLNDISDAYKHLTNFSIQKTNARVTNKDEDLVMSQSEFIKKAFRGDASKAETVREKMEAIIVKTMRTGQESGIEHKPNCFEVYGFDFMLDQHLNPWLLEVNLSPACAERTEWLVAMLDRMANGLFNLLERRLAQVSDDFKGELKGIMQAKKAQDPELSGWKLAYDQQADSENYKALVREAQAGASEQPNRNMLQMLNQTLQTLLHLKEPSQQQTQAAPPLTQATVKNNQDKQIEVVGTKAQPRAERKVQQLYLQHLAAKIIQTRFRGYRAKKRVLNMKFELIVVYIQSNARMFLAKLQLRRLKQQRVSVTIQKYLRRVIAKKVYFRLRSEAYDRFVLEKIMLIQKHARVFIEKQRAITEMRHQQAARVQKFLRGLVDFRKVKAFRNMIAKATLIQRFYRARLEAKDHSAVLVQRFIKGRKQALKYRRLAQVKKATVDILLRVEQAHLRKRAVASWARYNLVQKTASKIQKAVRDHLKKQQQTMNRTRCVKFYWRKLCRLQKYYKCIEACRLIKSAYRARALKIVKQYRVFKLRRCLNERIQEKKAKVVQKYLRLALFRNRWNHFERNEGAIIFIQSVVRMLHCQRQFRAYLRSKMKRQNQARKFEETFLQLYNQKPSQKRKNKINQLLSLHQHQQDQLLLRERVFLRGNKMGSNMFYSQFFNTGVSTSKPTQKALSSKQALTVAQSNIKQLRRVSDSKIALPGQSTTSNRGQFDSQYAQLLAAQKEKTLKALKYIKKHQHLYNDPSIESFMKGTPEDMKLRIHMNQRKGKKFCSPEKAAKFQQKSTASKTVTKASAVASNLLKQHEQSKISQLENSYFIKLGMTEYPGSNTKATASKQKENKHPGLKQIFPSSIEQSVKSSFQAKKIGVLKKGLGRAAKKQAIDSQFDSITNSKIKDILENQELLAVSSEQFETLGVHRYTNPDQATISTMHEDSFLPSAVLHHDSSQGHLQQPKSHSISQRKRRTIPNKQEDQSEYGGSKKKFEPFNYFTNLPMQRHHQEHHSSSVVENRIDDPLLKDRSAKRLYGITEACKDVVPPKKDGESLKQLKPKPNKKSPYMQEFLEEKHALHNHYLKQQQLLNQQAAAHSSSSQMQKYEKARALSPIDKKLGSSLKKGGKTGHLLKTTAANQKIDRIYPQPGDSLYPPEKTTSYYSMGKAGNPSAIDDYSNTFHKARVGVTNREGGQVEMKANKYGIVRPKEIAHLDSTRTLEISKAVELKSKKWLHAGEDLGTFRSGDRGHLEIPMIIDSSKLDCSSAEILAKVPHRNVQNIKTTSNLPELKRSVQGSDQSANIASCFYESNRAGSFGIKSVFDSHDQAGARSHFTGSASQAQKIRAQAEKMGQTRLEKIKQAGKKQVAPRPAPQKVSSRKKQRLKQTPDDSTQFQTNAESSFSVLAEAVAPFSGMGHQASILTPSDCCSKQEAKSRSLQNQQGKKKSQKQKTNRPKEKVDLGKLLVKPGTSPKNGDLNFIEIKLDQNPVKKSVDFRSKMMNQKDYLPQNVQWPSIVSNRNPSDQAVLMASSQQSSVQSLKPRLQKRMGANLEKFPGAFDEQQSHHQLINDYYRESIRRKQSGGLTDKAQR